MFGIYIVVKKISKYNSLIVSFSLSLHSVELQKFRNFLVVAQLHPQTLAAIIRIIRKYRFIPFVTNF